MRVYLDNNATMPLYPAARSAMQTAMDVFGNPSSIHCEGRQATALIEQARLQIANAIDCALEEVIFTSGATEGINLLANWQTPVNVDEMAHEALWVHHRPGDGGIFAMGLANSETGIITQIPKKCEWGWHTESGKVTHLMLDVTQVIGRLPFSFCKSKADIAILSAHKLGGPKGVGALIIRRGIDCPILIHGGGQELGRRSGTQNVIGIAGFGAAIEAAMKDLENGVWSRVENLRDFLETELETQANDTIFVGRDVPRLPNTTCFISNGWKGETQVIQMDIAGFAVSAGSACSSGKVNVSRVLAAMGYSNAEASCAIRVSMGPETKKHDVLRFCEAWLKKKRSRDG
ncbi:MAG: cysteine desulfurase family protein [Aestuariivita sp.]|nr:cysteine desulfurase family protein [Aestuariivita sp.]